MVGVTASVFFPAGSDVDLPLLEQCEPGLIFWLIEELLDSQTIEGCRKVFDYLESRREINTAVRLRCALSSLDGSTDNSIETLQTEEFDHSPFLQ